MIGTTDRLLRIGTLVLLICIIASCNKDDVIEGTLKPEIILDHPSGVYEVKIDRELTIAPEFRNLGDGSVKWMEEGVTLSTDPVFTASWSEEGQHFITVLAIGEGGTASEEIRVDVVALQAPLISLPFEGDVLTVLAGTECHIQPEFSGDEDDDFKVSWTVNGEWMSSERSYRFYVAELKDYDVELKAENSDGSAVRQFIIRGVDTLPYVLKFTPVSYTFDSTDRYTFPGRTVYLSPIVSNLTATKWEWFVDGQKTDCDTEQFLFTPEKPGTYTISVLIDSEAMASVKVICVDSSEDNRMRTGGSLNVQNKVYEYIAAPGQFIGDTKTGGMTGAETTHEAAIAWAEQRLKNNNYVSLGGFGGYLVVGFDHSIPAASDGYDFYIQGNAFFNAGTTEGGSNEPGIVYVMQDVNGNGLPDDQWYELRGSETGKAETISDYAVTYYRPAGPGMNVQWTDNYGGSGTIDYLPSFHNQSSYYPAWIKADSYTLCGTRLKDQTWFDDKAGIWNNSAFGWGYSDNMGSDSSSGDLEGTGQQNGFKISNAIYPDGTPVNLKYIDFVKVQTGVNAKAGWIGENSTEVFGVRSR